MKKKQYKHKTKNLPTNPDYCMITPNREDVFKDTDESTVHSNQS